MATTIKTKNSTTAATAPTGLVQGELAVNITDKKLYVGDSVGNSIQIAGAGATNAAGGSTTQVQYNSSGALAGSANMTFDGTTLTVNGLATTGTVTVGDASGDALTINSSAVSIPNGLNFDSNTFVIDATNNRVGVGVASPSFPLDVLSSGTSLARFTGAQYSQIRHSDGTRVLYTQVYDNAAIFGTESSTPLLLVTGGTERARIDTSGNVGIGTSSPSSYANYTTVTQNGTNGVEYDFKIGGTLAGYFEVTSTLFKFDAESTRYFQWVSNGTEKMRLDSSGSLGLGVSPSGNYQLQTPINYNGGGKGFSISSLTGGASGNGVPYVGYNFRTTGTADSYTYNATDVASAIRFYDGIQFKIAASGTAGNAITFTQAMTLDASGNLGIGKTSPAYKLDLYGGAIRIDNGGSAGTIYFVDTNGYINYSSSTMQFAVNGAERMRIASNGNVLVGTTNAAVGSSGNMRVGSGGTGSAHQGTIILDGSTATNYGPCIRYYNNDGFLADAGDYAFIVGSSTHQYAIRCGASGGVYLGNNATSWSAISDETQKNIIEPITDGLNKVASLRSVIGSYKTDETNTRHPFLIAQDVKAVLPEAVSENEHDGETVLGVAYTDVIPLLVAAIKELKAEVDSLKAQLAK